MSIVAETGPFDAVPAELRARDQWVLHHKKVLYNPHALSRRARTNVPATWGSYDLAAAKLAAVNDAAGRVRGLRPMEGIGFVFCADDPYVGIDFDGCIYDDEIHPAALKIIAALGSYTEVSPSGTGIHIIARARLTGAGIKCRAVEWADYVPGREGAIEIYDRVRYFTITGDGSGAITERQSVVNDLVLRYPSAGATVTRGSNGQVFVRKPPFEQRDDVPTGERHEYLLSFMGHYACSPSVDRSELEDACWTEADRIGMMDLSERWVTRNADYVIRSRS